MSPNSSLIYLDYNATTPIDPGVREAMAPFLNACYGNPSSLHSLGKQAAEAIAVSRNQLARLLDCRSNELTFTSGGTESSNLAICGSILALKSPFSSHMITSAIEHPATLESLRALERQGCGLTVIGCDKEGRVDPDSVAAAIRPNTALVSLMHANNEVGTIQPVSEVAKICKTAGILFHVDAAQSVGKLAVSVKKIGADLLTIAGHKFYAPKGIGGLYVREGIALSPLVYGGGQEGGLSPGTENVPHIMALGAAAQITEQRLKEDSQRIGTFRDQLECLLEQETSGQIIIHAKQVERLPNTTAAAFPDVNAKTLLEHLPHLCVSTGAACHSSSTKISATLQAMGMTESEARGTVRISLGRYTTADEVQQAGHALVAAWQEVRKSH